MISVITETLCISLPDRFLPGRPLTAVEAEALESIRIRRLKWIINSWLTKGMSPAEAQVHLEPFAANYEFSARPLPESQDPVDLEALTIARELVRRKVAEKDLSLEPQSLEAHTEQLAKMPGVRNRAQNIVRIRQETAKNLVPRESQ